MVEVLSSRCADAAIADDDHRGNDSPFDCRAISPWAVYVPLTGSACHKELGRSKIQFFCCILRLQAITTTRVLHIAVQGV